MRDPDWFFYLMEKGVFTGAYSEEAKELDGKAKKIKQPNGSRGKQIVRYLEDRRSHKLTKVDIVPKDEPAHDGSSIEHRSEYIDLSLPRKLCSYDKAGGKMILRFLKDQLFGDSSRYLTRDRCEGFFDDDENFGT